MIPDLHFLSLFLRLSIDQIIRCWSKPATGLLATGTVADLSRSRIDLLFENAMLCQQLIILNRQVKRPRLTSSERVCLVTLARFSNFWQQAILINQPDTILRWHGDLFRLYWRRKLKNNQYKPHISPDTITLHKADGAGESVVGRRTNPGGIAQAQHQSQQTYHPALYT